jgi:DnaK suppressor protein
MATKKTKKKVIQKTTKKVKKTSAKKTPLKTKLKAKIKSKPASKKTAVKKQVKPAKKGKQAPKRNAVKKVPPAKTKSKAAAKTRKTIKQRQRLKPSTVAVTEEERNRALKKLLISKRQEIFKEVKTEISKYIKGETRQLVDTALDDGDWSIVDLSEDISFKHLSTHRENLLKIDEALRKLDEGTYGICEDCGEEITQERLNILPFAIYCIDCQEKREKIEEMERREGLIG